MAAKTQRYKLTLSKLDFVSLVDDPAQPNATTLLIKRKGKADGLDAVAKFLDADEQLGLAWFWAFTSTEKSGEPHYDHHGDQVLADTDMVKAVLDYMKRGGAVDEMHDYASTDGHVVFAMPVTLDVAKKIGIEQTGLLVTIKCTDEQITKLKDGTYTGVSIAGLGTRELVEACKSISRVVKGQLITDEQDGHQHTIEVLDDGSLWCSYNTATGAEYSHNHAVIRGTEGAIEILADSGHSHSLAADQPAVVIVAPSDIVVVAEVVAARRSPTTNRGGGTSRASESPRPNAAPSMVTMTTKNTSTETTAPDAKDEKIVSLTKRAERAEAIAKMTPSQKTHFDTLTGEDADSFIAKSSNERDAIVKTVNEGDPVEFSLDGVSYRKSTQGYTLAKRVLAQADSIEKAEIEKQTEAHLGNLAGDKADQAELIRAVYAYTKSDLEKRGKLLALLDGANAIAKGRAVPAGGSGGDVEDTTPGAEGAYEALATGLEKFCTEQKIDKVWTVGLEKFKATPAGEALKKAYDAERAAAR